MTPLVHQLGAFLVLCRVVIAAYYICDDGNDDPGYCMSRQIHGADQRLQPLEVYVTRGEMVESRHLVDLVVVDAADQIVECHGDIDHPIYGRSAIKPLLALPLVETGAADALSLTPEYIALACASHHGEERHVTLVQAWLSQLDLRESDLECGAHYPYNEQAARSLVEAHMLPSPRHNNCSGKHTGFLTCALHMHVERSGYISATHPVQQLCLNVLQEMSGLDLATAPRGIDGCGIPVIGFSLRRHALALARMANPVSYSRSRQAACERILESMQQNPWCIAGTREFDTQMIEASDGRAIVKGGAEGVYAGVLREFGYGVFVKARDGSKRAAAVAIADLLVRAGAISGDGLAKVVAHVRPQIENRAKTVVGRVIVGLPSDAAQGLPTSFPGINR